ncbi:MAG TPA: hypothetical protein VGK19_16165 [Capsulimonadaceae bacterium]
MSVIHALYDPCERFFFHLCKEVPGPAQPFVGYILLAIGVMLYIWSMVLLGRWAESKGQRYWVGVWLGILTGPLVGALFIAYLNDAPTAPSRASKGRARSRKRASAA